MSNTDAKQPIQVEEGSENRDRSSVLNVAGQALFRLGRLFSKYPMREQLMQRTGKAIEVSRIVVTEAVAAGPEEPGQEITVGVVASRLGIDPSTASRLVMETINAGYLSRSTSQADSRRLRLELTDMGRKLVEEAHHYQRVVFEHVTREWSEQEQQEFARLLVKFVASVAENYTTITSTSQNSSQS
ncbi:MAG TPA: MarR family winged helix-turn-helix transcriptional regulator [Ktedonobacteraceae bacterium]|jgi:DNA-binding MarR family transcriptional regulator